MTIILIVALLTVVLSALLLALHPCYHAGLFGTLGLGLIALGAVSRIDALLEGAYIHPAALLVWMGIALFLGQLAMRFLMRCKECGGWRFLRDDRAPRKQEHRERAVA